jgi:CubicO group peptidase (beta-lactamase class C family)
LKKLLPDSPHQFFKKVKTKKMKKNSTLLLVAISVFGNLINAQYQAKYDMSSSSYQNEYNKWIGLGYRLADVTIYNLNGSEGYAAIWNKQAGPSWSARHSMSETEFVTEVNERKNKGYRAERLSVCNIGTSLRFACIFFQTPNETITKHNLTEMQYQAENKKWGELGYRLVEISGYNRSGAENYAAVWEKLTSKSLGKVLKLGMTKSEYSSEFDKQAAAGYLLDRISGFEIGGQERYAAIFEKKSTGIYARNSMETKNFQVEFDNCFYQGATLVHLNTFTLGGKPQFNAVWTGGMSGADLNFIDSRVNTYMSTFSVPGFSIAVSRNGRLVFAQGYGLANKSTGEKVGPNSLFRIASVSKPITATAIMNLKEEGKLSLGDRVFGPKGILGNVCDALGGPAPCIDQTNLEKITVQHCLEHATGWPCTNTSCKDAVWVHYELNNSGLIEWAVKNYDQTSTPGTNYAYMNFDYFLLGRIIEKKSGQSYQNYVKSAILSKAGITHMRIGSDNESGKANNEVTYYGSDPYGLRLTRMDANGGWIARPMDLLKFMTLVDGESAKTDILAATALNEMFTVSTASGAGDYAKGWRVDGNRRTHNGTMDGTQALLVRFSNGISVAILINTQTSDTFGWNSIYTLAQTIANSAIAWPGYDLFPSN